jgi:hypothetical protein
MMVHNIVEVCDKANYIGFMTKLGVFHTRGCHTFLEVREWVLGEWGMRKKRSQ